MQRLILAGGGHAHIEVLRRFGLRAPRDVEIVLISPSRYTAYSGMLPGLIAGHYSRRDAHIDLERLAHRASARFICDAVVGIDATRRLAYCGQHAEASYDWLSLDIGSVPNTESIREAERFGFPVRPVDRLLAGVEALAQRVRQSDIEVAIIGAGAGGVELCLALDHRLRREATAHRARFSILTLTSKILPGYSEAVRRHTVRVLEQRHVVVYIDSRVAGVTEDGVLLEDGRRIAADHLIWVTGPAPARWLRESGLATDPEGFVLVDDHLRSVSHPQVFAAGDVATMAAHPRPKSGVYAVRQGPPLARNLHCVVSGLATRSFKPQRRALQLISTGERRAIAAWGELSFEGAWVWR